jgi:hypothetical protein
VLLDVLVTARITMRYLDLRRSHTSATTATLAEFPADFTSSEPASGEEDWEPSGSGFRA